MIFFENKRDKEDVSQTRETLALVPIRSGERLLRHDLMNIFACHKDKLSLLQAHFTEKEI